MEESHPPRSERVAEKGPAKSDPRAHQRRRLVTWLPAVLVVLLICTIWYAEDPRDQTLRILDLTPSYVAGSLLLQGQYEAIYPHSEELWPRASGGWHPAWRAELERLDLELHDAFFAYSPMYLLLVMVPVVKLLSISAFAQLFFVCNALCALLIGSESLRLCGVRSPAWRMAAGLATALSFPATYAAGCGQNTIIVCALLLLALRLLLEPGGSRGVGWRLVSGTALLCLVFLLKPWVFLILGLFLLTRRWLVLAVGSSAWLLLTLLLPRLLVPSELLRHYSDFSSYLPFASCLACNNFSLRGFIHRLSWPGWLQDLSEWRAHRVPDGVLWPELLILGVAALLFAAVVVWRRPRLEVTVVAALALLILVPGISWSHYLVLVIPLTICACCLPGLAVHTRLLGVVHACWLLAMQPHPVFFRSVFSLDLISYRHIPLPLLPYWFFVPTLAWLILLVVLLLDHGSRRTEQPADVATSEADLIPAPASSGSAGTIANGECKNMR